MRLCEVRAILRFQMLKIRNIHWFNSADRATINLWIQEVGDVNHEDEGDMYHQGGTALMWAIVFGNVDI